MASYLDLLLAYSCLLKSDSSPSQSSSRVLYGPLGLMLATDAPSNMRACRQAGLSLLVMGKLKRAVFHQAVHFSGSHVSTVHTSIN